MGFWKRCVESYKHPSLSYVRRLIAAAVGGTVLLAGVALLVLPGPAFLVIPLGLAILATEFVWAQRLLKRAKDAIRRKPASKAKNQEPALKE